jgi:hypothetical protein
MRLLRVFFPVAFPFLVTFFSVHMFLFLVLPFFYFYLFSPLIRLLFWYSFVLMLLFPCNNLSSSFCYPTFLIKKNECRLMRSLCCLCVCKYAFVHVNPDQLKFEFLNQSLWNLVCTPYIMAPDSTLTTYSINPSHQYVCLYVYPSYCCKATAR